MNDMLVQPLPVIKHREEMNGANAPAIALAFVNYNPFVDWLQTHQGHIPSGQGHVAQATKAKVSDIVHSNLINTLLDTHNSY